MTGTLRRINHWIGWEVAGLALRTLGFLALIAILVEGAFRLIGITDVADALILLCLAAAVMLLLIFNVVRFYYGMRAGVIVGRRRRGCCGNCGRQLDASATRCLDCGAKVPSRGAAEPTGDFLRDTRAGKRFWIWWNIAWLVLRAAGYVALAVGFAAVGYTFLRWRQPETALFWGLMAAAVMLLLAVNAVRFRYWFRSGVSSALKRYGCCTRCGYDLRASAIRCPECGTPIRAPGVENIEI